MFSAHGSTPSKDLRRRILALTVVFAFLFSMTAVPPSSARTMMPADDLASSDLLRVESRRMTLPASASLDAAVSVQPAAASELFASGFETWPGSWAISGPVDTPTWGQTSYRASAGTYSAYCAGSSIPAPGPYVNDMQSWMVAGPFDLSTYELATLSFDLWINAENGFDYLWAGASTDGLNFDSVGWSGDSGGWEYGLDVNLADVYGDGTVDVTGNAEVWIAFIFQTDGSETVEGAYIDDVSISATEQTGDVYEPDDTSGEANAIVVDGAAQQHTIDPSGDEDWVSFAVTAGWSYSIWTAEGTPADSMDTILGLYDSDGTTLLYEDDDGGEGVYSQIDFTAPASKTVYARVTGYAGTSTGAYALQVTGQAPPPNTPPVATADDYETDAGVQLVVAAPGVLSNDDDEDEYDVLTAHKMSDPAHGTVTLNTNGGFTYTPAAGFFGVDTFTYRTHDGEAYSGTVAVTITVSQVLPPVLAVAGANRFDTAVQTSKLAYPTGATTVVIATGRNWPDALGGSALAGALEGPILLTEPSALPAVVLDEIRRLGATHAVILGGTSAVSSAVEGALKAELGSGAGIVDRIAGSDRYDTANRVARRVIDGLGAEYDGTAFVATGGNFPDALAAAPLAAARKWPLFLSHPTRGISAATKTAMAGVSDVIILGGTAAVSSAVETDLKTTFGTTRIAGSTRYDTAAKLAAYGVDHAGLIWNRVGVATGTNYPDALAGGVLQGKAGTVMLLTPSTTLCTEAGMTLLTERALIDTVTFFGGTAAVSQATRDDVADALAGTWTPPNPPTGVQNGVWHGIQAGTAYEAITLNIVNNTITSAGSTLENGAAMIVRFNYTNVEMVLYVYQDIPITNGQFSHTWGSVNTIGGRKTVSGTFGSATSVNGSASHEENSFGGFTGSMSYQWSATR